MSKKKKGVVTHKDVARLFKGKDDITIKALSDIAFHLGMVCRIDLVPVPREPTE